MLGLVLVFGVWCLVLGAWYFAVCCLARLVWVLYWNLPEPTHSIRGAVLAGLCCHLPSEAPFQKQGISVSQVGSEQGREWSGVDPRKKATTDAITASCYPPYLQYECFYLRSTTSTTTTLRLLLLVLLLLLKYIPPTLPYRTPEYFHSIDSIPRRN